MQDRINFNRGAEEIEQHFANLHGYENDAGGGLLAQDGRGPGSRKMAPDGGQNDQLQQKLKERQKIIEQYTKLRRENQRSRSMRHKKILQILEGTKPTPFDDPSKKLEKKILRESLSLLLQQQMQTSEITKNRNWYDINNMDQLNMDQNSKGLPRLPRFK